MCAFACCSSVTHSCLDCCTLTLLSHLHSLPSGLIVWGRGAIQHIYKVSRCKAGSHSHPNPPKAPLFFPAGSMEMQASLHRCILVQNDSHSLTGLSSPCVALRHSTGGFPVGHSCSYTLNNTGNVVLQTTSLRSAEMNTKMPYSNLCCSYN